MKYEIREYQEGNRSPYRKWFCRLDGAAKARIFRHVVRMENGNLGDSKSIGDGVQELRMHFGAGYRIYYGRDGDIIIILLGGGSKRGQSRDIKAAKERWVNYLEERD